MTSSKQCLKIVPKYLILWYIWKMVSSAVIDQDFKMENNIQMSDQDKVSLADPDHFLSSVSDQKRLTKTKLRMVPDVLSRTGCGI